jgi:glycosyltransferase involved in cell wall biosynthesis
MDKPFISVIIPVRNGANYLRDAITSAQRQELPVEIIVVDDGSTDETAAIAAEAGCLVLRHEVSKGQVAGKNTGLKMAAGRYVVFLDHDDVVRDGAWRSMSDVLEQDPSVSAVQAMVKDFLSPEIPAMPGTLIRPEPYYGLFTGAVLIRREVFDQIGPFSEGLHTGDIIEWFQRMEQHHLTIRKVDMVSTDRRIHQTNFGKTDAREEMKNYAAVLRERLKALRNQQQ